MIDIKQWNVKQIVIGFLICVMTSAVLITTLSAQAEIDPAGFAWELRLVPQDSGIVVAERDIWLVDNQGEMIDESLATFSRDCKPILANHDVTVDAEGINLYGGFITCNLPGIHMSYYNYGDRFGDGNNGWPGIDSLWGIQICNYSYCELSDEYLHEFSIETTALPSDDTTNYGAFLSYGSFNRSRSVMLLNPSGPGWATRSSGSYTLSQALHNWGNTAEQVYFSSSCPNDGTSCSIEYSIDDTTSGSFPSNTTAYRHNMGSTVLHLGVASVAGRELGRFHGEVEYVTIRGLSCEECSND